eukprot:3523983-Alexandrium_andersonii.AAC.1
MSASLVGSEMCIRDSSDINGFLPIFTTASPTLKDRTPSCFTRYFSDLLMSSSDDWEGFFNTASCLPLPLPFGVP